MKMLRNISIVVVLLLAGVSNVWGDTVYTVDDFISYIGSSYSGTNIYYLADFTFDGLPNENVYIIGLSQFPDGYAYLNVAGFNNNNGTTFTFRVYGDELPISVLELYVIIDDGDGELFSVNTTTGQLNIGLGDDQILTSDSISINGGAFGDTSAINYVPSQSPMPLDSVAIETPPVVLTSPKNATSGIDPNTSLVWQGKAGSEFNVHLYDDKGGPVYVFPGLTDTSLDVNGYLDWNTTYNWQVDEVIGGVVTYSSPVWTFTTADYECESVLVGDLNGDCKVNFIDFAMMTDNWLEEVPKIPAGSGG